MRGVLSNGAVIRQLRKLHGLTQEKLAARAGCDVKTIRNAERGRRLDVNTMARIAEALTEALVSIICDETLARSGTRQLR